jgi:hypothetical protein
MIEPNHPAKIIWGFDEAHPFCQRLKEFRPDWIEGSVESLSRRSDLQAILITPQVGFKRLGVKTEPPSTLAEESNFVDALEITVGKKIVPGSFLARQGARALNLKFPELAPERAAFLTVGSPWAWGVVRVLIALGYKEFVLLVADDGEQTGIALELIEHFSQKFFDIRFEILPNATLVLQKPKGSFLFNTLSQEQMDRQMGNLHFLNFLAKGSLVLNHEISAELGLLKEAHELGLSLLSFEDLYFEVLSRLSGNAASFDRFRTKF